MIIPAPDATAFIQGYTQLMVEIHGPVSGKKAPKLLNVLAAARLEYLAKPALLDQAIRRLAAASVTIPDEVVSAIRGLQVRKWVYLRDSRSHSVFIDPSGTVAYGVLGLTERIRDVIGGSGAMVETGLFRYGGRYVTDGIVSEAVCSDPRSSASRTMCLPGSGARGRFMCRPGVVRVSLARHPAGGASANGRAIGGGPNAVK